LVDQVKEFFPVAHESLRQILGNFDPERCFFERPAGFDFALYVGENYFALLKAKVCLIELGIGEDVFYGARQSERRSMGIANDLQSLVITLLLQNIFKREEDDIARAR
jgi:hypothetical protein